MPRRKAVENPVETNYNSPPAFSPRERENQVIAKAYDLAEKRIMEGIASPSEIVFFLKLGSSSERLEQELHKTQHELLTAKTEAIRDAKDMKEMYAEAIKAFTDYKGGSRYNLQDEDVPF